MSTNDSNLNPARPDEPVGSGGRPGDDSVEGAGQDADTRLTELVTGSLAADDAARLEAELAANPDSPEAKEFRELQAAWQLFDQLPEVAPSPELEQSVLQAIRSLPQTTSDHATDDNASSGGVSHLRSIPPDTPETDSSESSVPSVERAMSRPSTFSLVARTGLQFLAPVAVAAALLVSMAFLFHDPADHPVNGPVADSESGLPTRAAAPDQERRAVPVLDGNPDGDAGDAGRVVVSANDPRNPIGAVAAPEPMNPPSASAPTMPEPMNPPCSYRYRSLDGKWHDMDSGTQLANLNCEIYVPAGVQQKLTMGATTMTVDGGETGTTISLVADPTAGVDADGNPQGVLVEAVEASKLYFDTLKQDGASISVRTPTGMASLGQSETEVVHDTSGNTDVAVKKGRVELAGFQPNGGVAAAVVREGEIATLNLLANPQVRKHLNVNWIGNWARVATLQQDLRIENPLAEGEVASRGGSDGSVGSLVAQDPDYADVPFIIDEHKVDVRISDGIAITTVEEVFHNTTQRTMEGVFWFPLPQDAAISQFSMWITQPDGTTREVQGEWLERKQARYIYEEYKYQRRDPALLEWMEGNTFRMSIFPIFANEKKRVKLTYTQILQADGDTVRYAYPLVSEKLRGNPVKDFALNVRVSTGAEQAQITPVSHKLQGDAERTAKPNAPWTAAVSVDNYTPGRDFVIEVKVPGAANENAFWSRTFRTAGEDGHLAGFFTPRFAAEAAQRETGNVVFMVDTSGSMNNERYFQQLALLEAMMAKLGEDDFFTVVTVDYAPVPLFDADGDKKFVPASDAQKKIALAALRERLRYGSTNLKAAFRYVWRHLIDPSEETTIIMLGDGIATQGEVRSEKLAADVMELAVGDSGKTITETGAKVRLFPVAIGNNWSSETLESLAARLQGRVIEAPRNRPEVQVATELFGNLTTPMLTDLTVTVEGDIDAAQVYPARFPALVSGQPVSFVARYGKQGTATIKFRGRLGADWKEWSYQVNLPESDLGSPEIGRYWAQRAIAGMQAKIDAGANDESSLRTAIVKLSKTYSVSSRHTSLLVLENNEEFKRWNIERTNETALAMKPVAGEPTMTIVDATGDVLMQLDGSDRWVSLSEYVARTRSNTVKLGTRIATPFNSRVTLQSPDGQQVTIDEKSTILGMDLPGARAAFAGWQEDQEHGVQPDDGTDNGGDTDGERENVSSEFSERAAQMLTRLVEVQKAYIEAQRERLRKILDADKDAARKALDDFEARVGAELTTDQQREALAEQVKKFREMIDSDDDPLVTWQLMQRYSGVSGYAKDKKSDEAEKAMGFMAGGLELRDETTHGSATTDALRSRLGAGSGGAAPGMTRRGEAQGGATFGGEGGGTDSGAAAPEEMDADGAEAGDDAAPEPEPEMEPEPAPAPDPSDARPAEQPTNPDAPRVNPNAGPATGDAEFRARGGRESLNEAERLTENMQRMRELQRNQQQGQGPGGEEDGRWSRDAESPESSGRRPANDPSGDAGPADRSNSENNNGTTPDDSNRQDRNADELRQERALEELRKVEERLALRAKSLIEEQKELLAELGNEELRNQMKDALGKALEAEVGKVTADFVRATRTLPAALQIRVTSQVIGDYTELVLAQFKAARGPAIRDLQFAPEGAKVLDEMQKARAASIRDQQQEDAEKTRFQQDPNGVTVFALDCSHTMSEALSAEQLAALQIPEEARAALRTKFDVARYELLNALGALETNEPFAIVLFSRTINYITAQGRISAFDAEAGWQNATLRANGRVMAGVDHMIRRLRTDDVSNLPGVFDALWANGLFNAEAGPLGRTAYIITDGWASWSPDSTAYLRGTGLGNGKTLENVATATFEGAFVDNQEKMALFIHTVGVGNHNGAYLKKMAEMTGGTYLDTTGGINPGEKTIADETPRVRVERNLAQLRKQAKNVSAWTSLIEWATGDLVKDNDLALSVWLAWAEVFPANHVIYEEMGEWLEGLDRKTDALRAFSNIVEVGYASPETHRYLGNFYRARSMWEAAADEYCIAREQAWHIAIAYFNEANVQAHLGNYEEAESLLYEILEKNDWPARYRNIKERATRELIVLYQQLAQQAKDEDQAEEASRWQSRLASLISNSPLNKQGLREFVGADVIVILDWDTDGTDVDLWLTKDGNDADKCFYDRMTPAWGAHLHEDQTEGFGPEFITLPKAAAGKYGVAIHYYSSNNQNIRSYCHVKVIVNVGTPEEQVFEHHIKLAADGVQKVVQTIEIKD